MARIVLLFGLALTLAAFGLTWLEHHFWIRDIGWQIYGIVIAAVFALLGIWIERQRTEGKPENTNTRNDKAIKALGLTSRELEVLECLRVGESNKHIARSLDISPNTVKTHLQSLYAKLGASNRTQAVNRAAELSIFTLV